MTLGEGKRKVLMLLDEYSSGGELTVVSLVAADTVEMQILRCVWQKDRLINALRRELAGRKE